VLIGGAGAFSVTADHHFSEPLREVVLRLIEADRPVFGACWGHQFLASATGGEVIEDKASTEVGTFEVEMTTTGAADPLFAETPRRFWVQLGHNDRVASLSPGWDELTYSDRCRYQTIRLADKPVYGTQFHSEMNEERLRQRLEVYLDDYVEDEEEYHRILWRLRPSIDADRLLARFLELYA